MALRPLDFSAAGCRTGRVRKARSKKRAGLVIAQRPNPGKVVARGTAVTLVVSKARPNT